MIKVQYFLCDTGNTDHEWPYLQRGRKHTRFSRLKSLDQNLIRWFYGYWSQT